MADGQDRRADGQVEDGTKQYGAHAAEAVEKGLGDAGAKERHADREPADQDAGGTERGTQLDRPGLEPRNRGSHHTKSYSATVAKINANPFLRRMICSIALIPAAVRQQVIRARVGHFATSDGTRPALVPVCFVLVGETLYHAIDAKPKSREPPKLQRVINIRANPSAALLVDHYEEDWRRLWYALFRGTARLIEDGPEHQRAVRALRRKYRQYRTTVPLDADALVIALDVQRLSHWQSSSPGRRGTAPRDPRA